MCVHVLLLQCAAVVKKDAGIEELEPYCLTETSDLIMDEAIVDTIELVDIIDDLLTFISNEFLYEGVSANGHAKMPSEENMDDVRRPLREERVGSWAMIRSSKAGVWGQGFAAARQASVRSSKAGVWGQGFGKDSGLWHIHVKASIKLENTGKFGPHL